MKKTQHELAQSLGYSVRHINGIFTRNRKPSIALAKKLEVKTGIPWTTWFEEKNTTTSPPNAS